LGFRNIFSGVAALGHNDISYSDTKIKANLLKDQFVLSKPYQEVGVEGWGEEDCVYEAGWDGEGKG